MVLALGVIAATWGVFLGLPAVVEALRRRAIRKLQRRLYASIEASEHRR